jgi:hypothetical protein
MTWERERDVDFTYPYYRDSATFTSPLPRFDHFNNVLQVFDKCTWFLIVISISLLLIFLLCISKVYYKKYESKLWFALLSAILNQGINPTLIIKPHLKVILRSWLFTCFFLNLIYSNCIFSLITIPNEHRIESIAEFMEAQANNEIHVIIMKVYGTPSASIHKLIVSIELIYKIYLAR